MKRYLIKCLPFVKRIETKWKRGKKKRKKSRKRGKTRCSDRGWNTIARFVKNSCATGHLLSWREMKVHEIITPGWWWRMIEIVIENIFFSHSIYIYISLLVSFPFDLFRFRVSRCDEKRQVKLSLSFSLIICSNDRDWCKARVWFSGEDRQLRQVFDYYSFLCTILFQNCIGKLKV